MASKPKSSCIIGGTIHGGESVSQRPGISLIIWRAIEIDVGTRHFVGYDVAASEGRVSTPILQFDAKTHTAVTTSGRVYALLGPPGHDKDGHYVWGIWKRLNRVKAERDVTDEYA